ncbi:MAG: tail fiber protein [Balneola sp.]
MEEPFVGEISLVPYTFAPAGWAFCEGQIVSISDYASLFSLIGDRFGGDGRNTFGLPDLRGRVVVGAGNSPVYGNFLLGQFAGDKDVQLDLSNLPAHNHAATFSPASFGNITPTTSVSVQAGTGGVPTNNPAGAYWGISPDISFTQVQSYTNQPNVTMNPNAVQVDVTIPTPVNPGGTVDIMDAGNVDPAAINLMQPYMVLHYVIALEGIYPSRP